MRTALRLAPLLLLVLCPPAQAQAPAPVEPLEGASALRGREIVFRVTDAVATRVVVEILAVQGDAPITVDAIEATREGDAWVARTTANHLVWHRPGEYTWRPVSALGEGPLRRLVVAPPAADARRSTIPRRYGRRRGGRRLLVYTRGLPPGVSAARLRYLASVTARRWGLRVGGTTTRRPGAVDGVSVLGFSSKIRSGALGANRRVTERRFRPRPGRAPAVETRLVDSDVLIRRDVAWFDGPGYPALHQYDLESVLIHELGHYAGNLFHRRRCTPHPLVDAGTNGEWWRGPRDWFYSCEKRSPEA